MCAGSETTSGLLEHSTSAGVEDGWGRCVFHLACHVNGFICYRNNAGLKPVLCNLTDIILTFTQKNICEVYVKSIQFKATTYNLCFCCGNSSHCCHKWSLQDSNIVLMTKVWGCHTAPGRRCRQREGSSGDPQLVVGVGSRSRAFKTVTAQCWKPMIY